MVTSFVNGLPVGVLLAGGYIDDFFQRFCSLNNTYFSLVKQLRFGTYPELGFTSEEPDSGVLQHIDLSVIAFNGLCWRYGRTTLSPFFLPIVRTASQLMMI